MTPPKIKSFVVCRDGKGHAVEHSEVQKFTSNFSKNSVGLVTALGENESTVYVIGEKSDYLIPNSGLTEIDPLKTGKGFAKKICNICHALKEHGEFAANQQDSKGRITTRPSCRVCRMHIENKPMSAAERKAAEKNRPKKGTLFKCPICRKESIVGVTAKIVLDHRHGDGSAREFICDSCNTGLGRFKNGENYLQNAIDYLARLNK